MRRSKLNHEYTKAGRITKENVTNGINVLEYDWIHPWYRCMLCFVV